MMSAYPDAGLIELGKQFDAARATARELSAEDNRLFAEYERVAAERGLPGNGSEKPRQKVMAEVGYIKAAAAFNREHHRAVVLMKAIHRHKAATTIEGIAVKLAAAVFDQSDFVVDDTTWTTDVAEEQLLKLSRQVSKLAGKRFKLEGARP